MPCRVRRKFIDGLEPVGLDYSIWPVFRAEIIAE
jgi:hypothetical protein